jgi:hypothetical protein
MIGQMINIKAEKSIESSQGEMDHHARIIKSK